MNDSSKVFNTEQLEERARNLTVHNGFSRVFVELEAADPPTYARLNLECYNAVALSDIDSDVSGGTKLPTDIFSIRGGSRIIGGTEFGQIRVTEVSYDPTEPTLISVKVVPVGDYSTYTMSVDTGSYAFDPMFSDIDFKFRPGCFNTNCAPLSDYEAPKAEPVIGYLAKDFNSFKHVLINALRERVPGWQPTSEADLDQVLIDLIAADADELSDYQDRVMNEAYLGSARKRVSLARYARLMDYHIHQGSQASTWLAVRVNSDGNVDQGFGVWTTESWDDNNAVIFVSSHDQECFAALNELALYTWGGAVTALEAGATQADLIGTSGTMTKVQADDLVTLLNRENINYLLIEQKLNPETGTDNGLDITARQILKLGKKGDKAPKSLEDPVNGTWLVHVHWREQDQLRRRYCFITQCPNQTPTTGVSMFHGNLIQVTHGRPHKTIFYPQEAHLGLNDDTRLERVDHAYSERVSNAQLLRTAEEDGEEVLPVLCHLPHRLLAYQNTEPGGERPTITTLTVEVDGFTGDWDEQQDLIESKSDSQHFVVETDELDFSTVRFGNNINGLAIPDDAKVTCYYQVGRGSQGNVGADTLTGFDGSASGFPNVNKVWNPLDVTDGRDPEPRDEIIRRVPHAYRARQLRAITLEDYVNRAEEIDAVSHAFARYAWTGSWRTVRLSIDLTANFSWDGNIKRKIADHLNAVRLIGEDLEIRQAQYVALDILLRVCADPDYWPEDLADELEQEFSSGYTADRRMGFFHPDLWTFGQPLRASQVMGRASGVPGVERVLLLSIRRWHSTSGPSTAAITISPEDLGTNEVNTLAVEPFEVIQVASDPNHLEKGRIQFDILGGRR